MDGRSDAIIINSGRNEGGIKLRKLYNAYRPHDEYKMLQRKENGSDIKSDFSKQLEQ